MRKVAPKSSLIPLGATKSHLKIKVNFWVRLCRTQKSKCFKRSFSPLLYKILTGQNIGCDFSHPKGLLGATKSHPNSRSCYKKKISLNRPQEHILSLSYSLSLTFSLSSSLYISRPQEQLGHTIITILSSSSSCPCSP